MLLGEEQWNSLDSPNGATCVFQYMVYDVVHKDGFLLSKWCCISRLTTCTEKENWIPTLHRVRVHVCTHTYTRAYTITFNRLKFHFKK